MRRSTARPNVIDVALAAVKSAHKPSSQQLINASLYAFFPVTKNIFVLNRPKLEVSCVTFKNVYEN